MNTPSEIDPSFKQSGPRRVLLRKMFHAFEAGGLRGVKHALRLLRIERRMAELQAAIDKERDVHRDSLIVLHDALNAEIGRQHQTRILAVTNALGRFAAAQQRHERRQLVRGVR